MRIESARIQITLQVREGIFEKVWGWTISVDGEILLDPQGEVLYASTRRKDIDQEIDRLRRAITDLICKDLLDEQ